VFFSYPCLHSDDSKIIKSLGGHQDIPRVNERGSVGCLNPMQAREENFKDQKEIINSEMKKSG
jgi:hypothetical protein